MKDIVYDKFFRRLLKALYFHVRSCTVCAGIILTMLIEEQQTAFWAEDVLTDCK